MATGGDKQSQGGLRLEWEYAYGSNDSVGEERVWGIVRSRSLVFDTSLYPKGESQEEPRGSGEKVGVVCGVTLGCIGRSRGVGDIEGQQCQGKTEDEGDKGDEARKKRKQSLQERGPQKDESTKDTRVLIAYDKLGLGVISKGKGQRKGQNRGEQAEKGVGRVRQSKMTGEGRKAEDFRMEMKLRFAQRLEGFMWRLFGCCVGCEAVVIIREESEFLDENRFGGDVIKYENWMTMMVCGRCEAEDGWMKGRGWVETCESMMSDWRMTEAVRRTCGRGLRAMAWIVEREVMFGDWGKGIVMEGVEKVEISGRADGKVGLKVKPYVEVGLVGGR